MARTAVKRASAWQWRLRGLRWTVPCAIAGMAIAVVAGGSGVVPVLAGGVVALGTTGRQLFGRRSVIIRRKALYVHEPDGDLGRGRYVIPRSAIGSITPIMALPILPAQITANEMSAATQTSDLSVRQIAPASVASGRPAAVADQPVMYEWHYGQLRAYTLVRSSWLDRRVNAVGDFLFGDRRLVLPRPNLRIEFAEPRLVRRRTLVGRLRLRSSRRRDGIEIAVRDVDDACERLDAWLAGR